MGGSTSFIAVTASDNHWHIFLYYTVYLSVILTLGGFYDIILILMQWTGQDFEDSGRFVFYDLFTLCP